MNSVRAWGWCIVIISGGASISLAVHHALTVEGMEEWVAWLYGGVPGLLAALLSHLVALQAKQRDVGWFVRLMTMAVMVGAMVINWAGVTEVIQAVAGKLAWLFSVVLDVTALLGLNAVLSPPAEGDSKGDKKGGGKADETPVPRQPRRPARPKPAPVTPPQPPVSPPPVTPEPVTPAVSPPATNSGAAVTPTPDDGGTGGHDEQPPVKLTEEQRVAHLRELLTIDPGATNKTLASYLGVNPRTVQRDIRNNAELAALREAAKSDSDAGGEEPAAAVEDDTSTGTAAPLRLVTPNPGPDFAPAVTPGEERHDALDAAVQG
ncbi:hypothetical protein AB0K18_42625 [Nonomuraea sp. NPDC049421]|uniref:hypothetical protein n=1 Tax=Nonomuraea sp. NPDC049421 TaxID=3155275 RepID=UPI003421B1CC